MTQPGIVNLSVAPRETGAKKAAELREGLSVPAVMYGPTLEDNLYFSVNEIELEKFLKASKLQFVTFTLDGKEYKCILKNVDFHPVTDRPLHVDFYLTDDTHLLVTSIPVRMTGTSKGVVRGGRLYQSMKRMRLKALPQHIPAELVVDISPLDIGNTLKVKDLELDNLTPMEPLTRTIVVVNPPKGGKKNIKE